LGVQFNSAYHLNYQSQDKKGKFEERSNDFAGRSNGFAGAQTKKKGSAVFSHTGVFPTNLMFTGVNCISVVKRVYMALPNIIKLFKTGSSGLFFH